MLQQKQRIINWFGGIKFVEWKLSLGIKVSSTDLLYILDTDINYMIKK